MAAKFSSHKFKYAFLLLEDGFLPVIWRKSWLFHCSHVPALEKCLKVNKNSQVNEDAHKIFSSLQDLSGMSHDDAKQMKLWSHSQTSSPSLPVNNHYQLPKALEKEILRRNENSILPPHLWGTFRWWKKLLLHCIKKVIPTMVFWDYNSFRVALAKFSSSRNHMVRLYKQGRPDLARNYACHQLCFSWVCVCMCVVTIRNHGQAVMVTYIDAHWEVPRVLMGMKTGPLGHQVFSNIVVDGTCHMSADKEQGSSKEEGEQGPSLFQHKLALISSPMKPYK